MSIQAKQTDVCPHCRTGVRFEEASVTYGNMVTPLETFWIRTPSKHWFKTDICACPVCGQPILAIPYVGQEGAGQRGGPGVVYPAGATRPLPPEVHAAASSVAADFAEAVAVLPVSRKASAALSRRCLQLILTGAGNAKKRDLADQIDEVLPSLPPLLAQNVDAIRHVGNFAAHPMKSTSTGTIVEVEDGEAEWLLDVLEELMDFYYVAPARAKAKRDALNQKLQDMGKPALKQP